MSPWKYPGGSIPPALRNGAGSSIADVRPDGFLLGGGGTVLAGFLGCFDDHRHIPPDTNGAVGINRIISSSNDLFRVQDRAGAVLVDLHIEDFWAPVGIDPNLISDPHFLYDPYNNRFLATIIGDFTLASAWVGLAVSDTGDPAGNWHYYKIKADPASMFWADFPLIGFNRKWVVVSANMFPNNIVAPVYSNVFVFDKSRLYNNNIASVTLFSDPTGFAQAPASTYDNVLDTEYLSENWDGTQGQIRISTVTGPPGSPIFTSGTSFPTVPVQWDTFPQDAPQPNTFGLISTGDSRMQSCFVRNGALWCSHEVGPSSGPARCSIQWFQLAQDGSVTQFGRIDDPGGAAFFYYPSIAVNSTDDALIGFSESSSTEFASAAFAFRRRGDAPGSMQPDSTYKDGLGTYTKGRWGDFSATMPDPLNDGTFWTVQEYAEAVHPKFGESFGTWWGHISVIPPVISLSLNPVKVFAGDISTATITLRDPAPAGGAFISISSSNPNAAIVPLSVTVPQGQTTAAFDVQTVDLGMGVQTADITASYGVDSATATLTIVPYVTAVEFFNGLFWVPAIADIGGNTEFGRVTIATPAPAGGQVIRLSSSDPDVCSVTPSITIPGGQTQGFFLVFTTPVALDTTVDITASTRSNFATGLVTVLAPVPVSLQLQPSTVPGGSSSAATVNMSGVAPIGGLDVTLSSDQAAATVPAVLHIQPGKTYGTFTVSTLPVTQKTLANIGASYNNVIVSRQLTITPAGLTRLTVTPSAVPGGRSVNGVVLIGMPAPAGGATIALSYTNSGALLNPPMSVVIPQGATSASFAIRTQPVPSDTPVTATASYQGTSKNAAFTVLAIHVVSLTVLPTVLHTSTTANATVFLSAPAGPNGLQVSLSATAGTVPAAGVKVLPNQTMATFTYTAPGSVPPGSLARITATDPSGLSASALVKIIP